MGFNRLTVMYGHLEGNAGKFAREPSGYLAIEAGIFERHGLDVEWTHVQGTEERYRRLEDGRAQISLVVGRASLTHFLGAKTTRLLGAAMNSCPYDLIAASDITSCKALHGQTIACREAPSRNAPLDTTFEQLAHGKIGSDLALELTATDEQAFNLLVNNRVAAAILPRPFGFWAQERGFTRIPEWPAIVDDPLPITIETTERLVVERRDDFARFIEAHRESIRHLNAHRDGAIEMLRRRFGHSAWFAAKTVDEYFICLDERLKVDFKKLEQLIAQLCPAPPVNAAAVADVWVVKDALAV